MYRLNWGNLHRQTVLYAKATVEHCKYVCLAWETETGSSKGLKDRTSLATDCHGFKNIALGKFGVMALYDAAARSLGHFMAALC